MRRQLGYSFGSASETILFRILGTKNLILVARHDCLYSSWRYLNSEKTVPREHSVVDLLECNSLIVSREKARGPQCSRECRTPACDLSTDVGLPSGRRPKFLCGFDDRHMTNKGFDI